MIVTTTGYPRSGTTWITRLLSDLLDSPIRTLAPDSAVITNFCQTGQGGYTILKTHLSADEWDGNSKVVFIQRDPRDVAVSAAHYLNVSLMDVITDMCIESDRPFDVKWHIYHKGGWYEKFARGWLARLEWNRVWCVQYEWLHIYPFATISALSHQTTGKSLRGTPIAEVLDRQRFDRHAANYPHAMRKGIVGDWKNHFKRQHGQLITEHLGQLMLEQGYIDRLDWWEGLPE